MSLLSNAKSDSNINDEKDTVGGNYGPKESGLYPVTVSMAYLEKSQGGAVAVNLTLKPQDGSGEIRQKLWIVSGDAKGNKNYYEKDGERFYLPGFNTANSLALLTLGKEIGEVDTEEKIVNVWSFDAKAEVPTKVEVLMELLDQEILVGIQKQVVDKQVRQDDGSYAPNGETREQNEIDKFFRLSDRMTTAEIKAGATSPEFCNTWDKKWTGVTRDRTTNASANAGQSGAPAAAAAANSSGNSGASTGNRSSLFAGSQ